MKKYKIVTYGCQMNKHDSERIAGILDLNGFTEIQIGQNDFDLLVFNTCCVREKAANRLYGNAQRYVDLRKNKLKNGQGDFFIAVGGCLAQNEAAELAKKVPGIDIIFGTAHLSSLPELLERAQYERKPVIKTDMDQERLTGNLPSKRHSPISALVQISTGCNNYCSYCIVPYVRGKEKSRPFAEIVKEVETLIEDGVKEVTLLGQNVNSYGQDLGRKNYFTKLLEKLNGISGLERIRFITSHPKDFSQELIWMIKEGENICEHLHLPVQAGSTRILNKMNRGYSKEQYLDIIYNIKSALPDCAITTDIMVGFPGETNKDFEETIEVVEKARFDNAFLFIYSPRKGTEAFSVNGLVPEKEKSDRFNQLFNLQSQISSEINQKTLGKAVEVLVEGRSKKDPEVFSGRTRKNKIVHIPGTDDLIHKMVSVTIKSAHTWYLGGTIEQI